MILRAADLSIEKSVETEDVARTGWYQGAVGDLGSSVEGLISRIEVEIIMYWQYFVSVVCQDFGRQSLRYLEVPGVPPSQEWEGTTGRGRKQRTERATRETEPGMKAARKTLARYKARHGL